MSVFRGFDASLCEFFEGLTCIDVNDKPNHPDHKPRYGFVDQEGHIRIPAIYDAAGDFSGGLAAVKTNGKWGYIDTEGRMVIPAVYDGAHVFRDALAAVELDSKWGYIDAKGQTIIAFIYCEAHGFTDGVALVKLNGKHCYIDTKGNEAAMSGSRAEDYFREGME